jgi:hypothetical protein
MTPANNKMLWTGRVLSGIAVLFLFMDGVTHVMNIAPVVDAMSRLGFPVTTAPKIGVLELVLLVLYVVPRTALLGAILWMGILGGAVASHIRVGDPLFTHVLFGVYVGILLWLGLYLREPKLRGLLPVTRLNSGGFS